MTPAADCATRRRCWAAVAEAAARHHRFIAGEDVSYGDPDLRRTGQRLARSSLLRAVETAIGAGVEQEEIIDVICSGDRTYDSAEARAYVDAVPRLRAAVEEINAASSAACSGTATDGLGTGAARGLGRREAARRSLAGAHAPRRARSRRAARDVQLRLAL